MVVITFRTDKNFKRTLTSIAKVNRITLSSYLNLVLTKVVKEELTKPTRTGRTLQEEADIVSGTYYAKFLAGEYDRERPDTYPNLEDPANAKSFYETFDNHTDSEESPDYTALHSLIDNWPCQE
ncbi:hypothetical protein HOG48_02560 [Candidatus Peregrinibacteria bacterium]|jgi:hypothetical protein|nr:hypothetical protein [Candidatus Peregrinibacteria bacterium]